VPTPKIAPSIYALPPLVRVLSQNLDWPTQNGAVVILRAMVPGHGQGDTSRAVALDPGNASAEGPRNRGRTTRSLCRASRLRGNAHHSGHQASARTARPRQATIMPHNVAVGGSESGHSARSSGCSLGVICSCRSPRGEPRSAVLPPLLPSPGSYPRTTRVRSRRWQLQPLLWSESQVAVYGRELPGCFVFTAIHKRQFKTGRPSAVRPVLAFVGNCDVSHTPGPTKRRSVKKAVQVLLPQSSTQLYVPVGQPFDVS
jgi:hypothetical protein